MEEPLPLAGYKVLDLTIARAGPTAVRLLADWGADVVKIEPPPARDGRAGFTGARRGPDEQNLHRNKRGLALNLKRPEGREVFLDLVRTSDVVVENFRADVKSRLGIEYEALKAVNPGIILASISGFGQDGPYSDRPGVDQIIQGLSGLMSVTGEPGRGPMRVGVAISDTSAGMFLGQGILMALLHREKTGHGQWVHTSLLEAMICKLDFQGARYTMSGEVPGQEGNHHPTGVPMGTFPAADGLVNVAASSAKMWRAFCETLDARHLLADPEFRGARDRARNREKVREAVGAVTADFTVAELVERLNRAGVPCGPINDIGRAFEDEQVRHLRVTRVAHHREDGDLHLLRSPINMSEFPQGPEFDSAAPDTGQDTDAILTEHGYTGERIRALRECEAIG